jgi:D-alanyl-D-alanine dipeptidase
MKYIFFLLMVAFCTCCKPKKEPAQVETDLNSEDNTQVGKKKGIKELDYDVGLWKEITAEDGALLDIRYATDNNFTKKQIYSCGRCFLRPEMAARIKTLQKDILDRYGMRLKLFDCYRPRPAQQKLWDIVPDDKYVTPPSKGSMHNRGLAVDVTLVGKNGEELDMGTAYDFFGPEAHVTYKKLPEEVLKNRKILTKMMEIHGLKGIETEWWHFSLKTVQSPFDDWEWPCE